MTYAAAPEHERLRERAVEVLVEKECQRPYQNGVTESHLALGHVVNLRKTEDSQG